MSPYTLIFGFSFPDKTCAPKRIAQGIRVIETSCTPGVQEQNDLDINFIDFASTRTPIWRNDYALT